jgi:hypothetical protein
LQIFFTLSAIAYQGFNPTGPWEREDRLLLCLDLRVNSRNVPMKWKLQAISKKTFWPHIFVGGEF